MVRDINAIVEEKKVVGIHRPSSIGRIFCKFHTLDCFGIESERFADRSVKRIYVHNNGSAKNWAF